MQMMDEYDWKVVIHFYYHFTKNKGEDKHDSDEGENGEKGDGEHKIFEE